MKRFLSILDRVGSVGAFLAAVAAPCCFPLFAAASAAVGLGALGRFEGFVLYTFQGFAVLSFVGLALGFRQHRRPWPLAVGVASVTALAWSFYGDFSQAALYSGLGGLLAATVWNRFCARSRDCCTSAQPDCTTTTRQPILQSTITCPECGQRTTETMPTDSCWFFYECPSCHARLRPKPGHCCVFCSYGSLPCPSIQLSTSCCA